MVAGESRSEFSLHKSWDGSDRFALLGVAAVAYLSLLGIARGRIRRMVAALQEACRDLPAAPATPEALE